MFLILSDDAHQSVGKRLYKTLHTKTNDVQYISVSNLNISTCYNCNYCHTKEYGKCCIKDDMQQLLYEVAKATHTILVCPLSFGSYSSKIKKAFDRLVVLGDTHYYEVNGELVKGTNTAQGGIWAIGVKDHCNLEEEKLFTHLVEENRKIMNVKGKGIVVEENPDQDKLNQFAEVILNA